MRQFPILRKSAPRTGVVFVLAATLALVACDNDMNITGPDWPPVHEAVWVTATLTSQAGGCTGAELFYDGQHIGARNQPCGPGGSGCGALEVTGYKERRAGRHTIEILVLSQTSAEVTYQVAAEVSDRFGGPVQIRLGPARRTLREGESVSFEFDLP